LIGVMAARWIEQERARHRPHARVLTPTERQELGGCFSLETLDLVRIRRVPVIENPSLYPEFALRGPSKSRILDLRNVAGITYGDTIVLNARRCPAPPPLSLLVHELVHVVQYAHLSVEAFAARYIRGWADCGFDYARIPLEVQAYALQAEFDAGTQPAIEHRVRASL